MRQVRRNEAAAPRKPERRREHRDDVAVLEDEAVLEVLEAARETDAKPENGGDPIKGVGIAVIAGAAIWASLAAALVLF